jgi:hypothetical protein
VIKNYQDALEAAQNSFLLAKDYAKSGSSYEAMGVYAVRARALAEVGQGYVEMARLMAELDGKL